MPMTRLEFSNYVVEQVRRVGSGQSPDIEDTQKVFDLIPFYFDFLEKAHIYVVSDMEEIENEAVHALALGMVWFLTDTFFLNEQVTAPKWALARQMFVLLSANMPTYERQTVDYF